MCFYTSSAVAVSPELMNGACGQTRGALRSPCLGGLLLPVPPQGCHRDRPEDPVQSCGRPHSESCGATSVPLSSLRCFRSGQACLLVWLQAGRFPGSPPAPGLPSLRPGTRGQSCLPRLSLAFAPQAKAS